MSPEARAAIEEMRRRQTTTTEGMSALIDDVIDLDGRVVRAEARARFALVLAFLAPFLPIMLHVHQIEAWLR